MTFWIARVSSSKELVGFFAGEDLEDVADLVDELCSPLGCEAQSIEFGGIFCKTGPDQEWPPDFESDTDFKYTIDQLSGSFYVAEEKTWLPLPLPRYCAKWNEVEK